MESIGGFEVVRRLGSGPRADVFLGRNQTRTASGPDQAVAIKVYRPSTSDVEIQREIRALSRAASDHLVRLIDVATTPDGTPALILGPVGIRKLSELVVMSRRLTAGEVVTATAPLVDAIAGLHRAGVSHGAVHAANVMFDQRGAPVLVGFGSASVVESARPHAGDQLLLSASEGVRGVATDLADLAVVIRCVGAASDADTTRVCAHLDRLPFAPDPAAWCAELEDALHDLAPGEPVRFDEGMAHSQEAHAQEARAHEVSALEAQTKPGGEASDAVQSLGERRAALIEMRAGQTPAWILALALPDTAVALLQTPVRGLVSALGKGLRNVRRPFWVVAGSTMVVLVASLVLIPQNTTSSARAGQGTDSAARASAPPRSDLSEPAPIASLVKPSPSIGEVSSLLEEASVQITGDDPVVALEALLVGRSRCFEQRSILCLDAVDQPGSAVWEMDSTVITRREAGELSTTPLARAGAIILSDRLGDSAILTATDADTGTEATVLVLRGETGWRIRDIIVP